MKRPSWIVLLCTALLVACSSGKYSYQRGDYFQAVLDAVARLRSNPDHRKSQEILKLSYPAAISFLETQVKNAIASNHNAKWRTAVQNYSLINRLYDEINRSPGAMQVIPQPQSRFNELKEAKEGAANEAYEQGLEAMLKNTREDAKRAYFLFKEANNLSPQYKESIEMGNQAKFNATLKVLVEPFPPNPNNWNFESAVFGYRGNEFVRFYTQAEAQNENLKRIDHYLNVVVGSYSESLPYISQKTYEVTDSVKTGEKKVNNVVIPIYKPVKAKVTTFTKTVRAKGQLRLNVREGTGGADINNQPILSEQTWSSDWSIYTGDVRALSQNLKQLTQRKEPFMSNTHLRELVRQDLDRRLAQAVASFYRGY